MEKRSSPKKRKSAKSLADKEKSAPTVRDAGSARLLYRSEVIENIPLETIPSKAISDREGVVSDSAINPIIDRATRSIGDRQQAMRWLGAPVRGIDFATPISLLATEEGRIRVIDILGQMEHGIW